MQAFYDNQPKKLEAVGNGSFRYRYNIREEEKPVQASENRPLRRLRLSLSGSARRLPYGHRSQRTKSLKRS